MNQDWTDIERVGLFDHVPQAVHKLTRTLERLSMSRFFCSGPIAEPYRRDAVDSWMVWASIVALPSPAKTDPIHLDMSTLDLSNEWEKSTEKQNLYNDPLLATLLEVRNFSVHVAVRKNHRKEFIAQQDGEDFNLGSSVYILPFDFEELRGNRNIQSGRSNVDQNMITWFNRQTESWPAHHIIGEARRRIMGTLDQFLKVHAAIVNSDTSTAQSRVFPR